MEQILNHQEHEIPSLDRIKEFKALLKTSLVLTSTLNYDEVLRVIAEKAGEVIGVKYVSVFLPDEAEKYLRIVSSYHLSDEYVNQINQDYPVQVGEGPMGKAFRDGRLYAINNIFENEAFAPWREPARKQGYAGIASIPLLSKGKILGVLCFYFEDPQSFTQERLNYLSTIANQAAVALENAALLQQLSQQKRELQSLSRRLLNIQEEERRRLARELHDEAGQSLTAIKLQLEILDRSVPLGDKVWKAAMSDMKQQVERSVEEIRRLSYELRPSILDDLGLVSTLRWYMDLFSKRTGIQVVLDLSDMERRLEMSVETALYRITQEALTNVARHAEASQVRVSLQKRYGSLVYLLEDNGKGFPMNNLGRNTEGRNSLGLLSIRERTRSLNGDVEIISRPGEGTQIKIKIPLVQG